MKKIYSSLLLMAMAITLHAAHLSPAQAFEAAQQSFQGPSRLKQTMSAKTAGMQHVLTLSEAATPTVYVYAHPTQSAGFMILAADDVVPVLLGYSDESTFDTANMPDNVAYWLNQYSLYIAQQVAADKKQPMVQLEEHDPIAPLCTTAWDQSGPFNDLCPVVSGSRSVTGCVATAIAQIMKTYEWPLRGEGSYSYSFSGGSASMDFSQTTFDWKNMLDLYPTSTFGTATQRNAVATLMLACGVGSSMGYSPNGSGAQSYNAALALAKYFKYDRSAKLVQRGWYTPQGWANLIYGELAQGYPIYYAGDDGTVGHAFVCDGYSADQYFHINWGWRGSYNGYFLLANLYPEGQGIGGGSGEDGFNYNQEIIYDLRKAGPDSDSKPYYQVMAFESPITTNKTTYSHTTSENIQIKGNGTYAGIYNEGICTIETGTLGVLLESTTSTDDLIIDSWDINNLAMYYGYSYIQISSTDIPEGTWRMYPGFTNAVGEFIPAKAPVSLGSAEYFIVEATASTVKITTPESEVSTPDIETRLNTWTPATSGDEGIYLGHTYTFEFQLIANNGWSNKLACVLLDSTKENVVANTTLQTITLKSGATLNKEYTLTIPADIAEGKYYIALATYANGKYTYIETPTPLQVEEAPTSPITVDYIGFEPINGVDEGLYPGHSYYIKFRVNTSSSWTGWLAMGIVDMKGNYESYCQPLTYTVPKGGGEIVIPFDLPTVATGKHIIRPLGVDGNYLVPVNNDHEVEFTDVPLIFKSEMAQSSLSEGATIDWDTPTTVAYDLRCTQDWSGSVTCNLYSLPDSRAASADAVYISPAVAISFTDFFATGIWTLNVPQTVPYGRYHMQLVSGTNILGEPVEVTVGQNVTAIDGIEADGSEEPARYFNLQGIEVAQPQNGIYIKRTGSKVEKVVIRH